MKMMKYNWIMYLMLILPLIFLNMMNFFSLWMIMEFNLLIFFLYLLMNNNELGDELFLYFLMNSFSSIFFLFFCLLSMFIEDYLLNFLLNMMMYMKLGIFPFYYVVVLMIYKLNWMGCFYLLLLQKLIPLMFLNDMIYNYLDYLLIIVNGLLSVIMCYNEMDLKKIMMFSSMNNVSWMLIMMIFSEDLFFFYYFIYYSMNYIMMVQFYNLDLNLCLDFFNLIKYKFNMMLQFLVLGGLPPFWGFLMKMSSIMGLMKGNLFIITLILIFYSLIFLYYYFRMMIFYLLMNYNLMKNLNLFYYNEYFYMNFYMYMLFILMFMSMMWCFLL